jgi:uncharacterized membrane protein
MNLHVFGEKPTFIPDPNDVNENKYLCILSYISILFIIPLILKPNSRYVKYHSNQGLILFIFEIAVGLVTSVLSFVFGIIYLGFIAWTVKFALHVVTLLLMIYGILSTCSGYIRPLPVIGDLFVAIK